MAATARRIRLRSYLSAGQKTSKRRRAIKGIVQSVWPKHPYILHNNRQYSAFKSEIATQSYMACVDTSSAEDGTTERSGYRTDMPVGGYKDTSRKMPDWKQQDAAERMAHAEHKADHQLVVQQTLRQDILQCLHSGPEGGHLGKKKTLWKIRQRFYWPDLCEDVADWCRKCPECNQLKSGNKHHRGQLEPQIAPYPMSRIGVDIIGPFQQTERGNKYILTVQDYFSKWPEAYPIPDMTASTVARTLVNEFICRYGAPESLRTNSINSAAFLKRHFATDQHNKIVRILSCAGSFWGMASTSRLGESTILSLLTGSETNLCERVIKWSASIADEATI
ncbi:Retrovirus-related Pol polyprotein from transposon [Trichinella sp. T9]|nr:Retrovirus-related Pol polyprotein from transposon [Trichinella sp. T9]